MARLSPSFKRLLLAAALAGLLLLGLMFRDGFGSATCADADRDCISKAYTKHQVRYAKFWADELAKPFTERLGPAPAALVDYLALANKADGYQGRPWAKALDAGMLIDVRAAMADIPPDVWRLAQSRLVGIYFVEKLGSTGYTDYVLGIDGKPTHAFVVLDAEVLGWQSANAWATWKENTPFKLTTQGAHGLRATIETPANDNRKNAIQYILLHELAHVISVGRKVHPDWHLPGNLLVEKAQYPFYDLSWFFDPSKKATVSRFDASWPQRRKVAYYRTPRLEAAEKLGTYQALMKTNFPTLYAATTPGDDFAESLVSYVHTVRMGKPWSVTIERDGEAPQVFESCWEEARCAAKRKLLEGILAGS